MPSRRMPNPASHSATRVVFTRGRKLGTEPIRYTFGTLCRVTTALRVHIYSRLCVPIDVCSRGLVPWLRTRAGCGPVLCSVCTTTHRPRPAAHRSSGNRRLLRILTVFLMICSGSNESTDAMTTDGPRSWIRSCANAAVQAFSNSCEEQR